MKSLAGDFEAFRERPKVRQRQLLKTLLFANAEKRIELNQFFKKLHQRHGLGYGDREAERVLAKDECDQKAFQANSPALSRDLTALVCCAAFQTDALMS